MTWYQWVLAIWGAGAAAFFVWQIVMYVQFWLWWDDQESKQLREEMRAAGPPHAMMVLMMLLSALWWPISLPWLTKQNKKT